MCMFPCVCVYFNTRTCARPCVRLCLLSKFNYTFQNSILAGGWIEQAAVFTLSQLDPNGIDTHTLTHTHTHTHTHKYCVHFSQCCHGNKSQPFNEMSRHSDQPTYTLILYTEEVLPWWFSDNILRQRVGFQSRQARGKNYYLDHCVFTDHVFLTLLHSGQWFDFYWRKGCRKNRFLNEEKRMNELEMAS